MIESGGDSGDPYHGGWVWPETQRETHLAACDTGPEHWSHVSFGDQIVLAAHECVPGRLGHAVQHAGDGVGPEASEEPRTLDE